MFDIEYNGGNSVTICTKNTKLVFDPKRSLIGLKDMNTEGAVEVGTEDRFLLNYNGSKVSICSPGEYEVGDFSIKGIAAQRHIDSTETNKRSVIYKVEVGDIHIAVLGNIAPAITDNQLENLGVIDILIIPVGGSGYTLDATSAVNIIRQIEPKIVVPVHYADENLRYEVPQDDIQTFIHELNAHGESMSKLKIKSASNIPESMTVVHLSLNK